MAALVSLRPRQWAKNLLVFAGLLFGLRLFDRVAVGRALAAFGIFCLSPSVHSAKAGIRTRYTSSNRCRSSFIIVRSRLGSGLATLPDNHHRRSNHALAEPVALLHD